MNGEGIEIWKLAEGYFKSFGGKLELEIGN
jgi:hypothetical protein